MHLQRCTSENHLTDGSGKQRRMKMAIIGTILGDIAGSQYEFIRPADLEWKKCELFTDRCYFTDDTVMTLAAKLAVKNKIPFADSYRELGRRYPHAGYGGSFEEWLWNDGKGAYNSFGNGSAMRCSYIGEHFNTEKEVVEWATKSAECTHNHEEGIKGAVVTAMCIYMARTGAAKSDIYEYVLQKYPMDAYRYSIGYKLDEYRDTYEWDVSCQGSVPVAIRCFLESDDYESFLRNVFSLECDMDTLCAIGGGIAEEFYHGTGFDEKSLLKKYLDENLYEIAVSQLQ